MQVIEFSSDPKCSDRTCVWFLAPLRAGFAQKFFFGLAMSDVPAQPKIVGWQNLPDRALGMKTPAGAASALTSGTETALRGNIDARVDRLFAHVTKVPASTCDHSPARTGKPSELPPIREQGSAAPFALTPPAP